LLSGRDGGSARFTLRLFFPLVEAIPCAQGAQRRTHIVRGQARRHPSAVEDMGD
jgi:hypothetical protein